MSRMCLLDADGEGEGRIGKVGKRVWNGWWVGDGLIADEKLGGNGSGDWVVKAAAKGWTG